MSRSAKVELLFGGEPRVFRLTIARLEAIDEKCDAGPMELLRRYMDGTWKVHDLREPILQGLIGGGATQSEASSLIRRYFDDLPLNEFVTVAQAVVMAAVVGAPGEDLGEGPAGEEGQNLSREDGSASPVSTE